MSAQTEDKSPAPAIGVSLQITLDQSRTLVLQTHVAQEIGKAGLDAALDIMAASADRQEAKYILVHKRKLLRQAQLDLEDTLTAQARGYEAAKQLWEETNPDRPFKAEGATAANFQNAEQTASRLRDQIEQLNGEIARLEELTK